MAPLVNDVHLFLCLDSRVAPGPILQCLDLMRASHWTQELILICDSSWRPFLSDDQPVYYLDRSQFLEKGGHENNLISSQKLDDFLEELDQFSISQVTQVGELMWGRWLNAYLETSQDIDFRKIDWNRSMEFSLFNFNNLVETLDVDISVFSSNQSSGSTVYVDPYIDEELSPLFLQLFDERFRSDVPTWLSILFYEKDFEKLSDLGLSSSLVSVDEAMSNLSSQHVICFSDQSVLAQQSRSYKVALVGSSQFSCLFLPGDISIVPDTGIDFLELSNIIRYWKEDRLRELAFQWFNMGINIEMVDQVDNQLFSRNLLNYSLDLSNAQIILENFTNNRKQVHNCIRYLRSQNGNDFYSLAFSFKLLILIAERMLAAAKTGERLFHRLGSDYHRIVIGEALVESFLQKHPGEHLSDIDFVDELKQFLKFLIQLDFQNDQFERSRPSKES